MGWHTERITRLAFLLTLGLMLSYIESLIPLYFGIPGAKPGLANLMVLLILYTYGAGDALLVNCMRIFVSSLLFGNMYGFLYSAAGAFVSFFAMWLLRRHTHISVTALGVFGGIFHNVGQMIVAVIMISHFSFFYYLPFLLVFGALAGFLTGRLAQILLKRGIL